MKNAARYTGCILVAWCALLAQVTAWAHQPVMDMAPRWKGGYGFQIRHESYGSDKLMSGDSEVGNHFNLDQEIDITWLEGIYTFHRGNELGLDVNLGWHPYHKNLTNTGVFVIMDLSLRNEARGRDLEGVTGGKRVSGGPVLVYYRQGMMIRAEYKYPFYEEVYDTQVSRGPELNIGIGFVF